MTRFIAKRYALVTCLLTIVSIADCAEAQTQTQAQTPAAIARTREVVPLAQWSDLLSRRAQLLTETPQAGLAYVWSRNDDVGFGPLDPSTFAKMILLPAGTWQFTVQFAARLSDGFDANNKLIRNAALRCQLMNSTGVLADEIVTTPALFHHLADFDYVVSITQPVTMMRIVTSDGGATAGVVLMCDPSAHDNSIGMQSVSITAVPLPGVVRKQE
jgi:hypothetical protein